MQYVGTTADAKAWKQLDKTHSNVASCATQPITLSRNAQVGLTARCWFARCLGHRDNHWVNKQLDNDDKGQFGQHGACSSGCHDETPSISHLNLDI